MSNAWKHFKTITYHKILVAKGCFRIGLYWQGLTHDLSKYSPTEFRVGVKYFQGDRSPNNAEREDIGYSTAWLHHKGRNKHHYEYWVDYNSRGGGEVYVPVPMPDRYIAEMVMDRIAASKVYRGKAYTDRDALDYFLAGKNTMPIHPDTAVVLEEMLQYLADFGEENAYSYIRQRLVHKKQKGPAPNKAQKHTV